MYNKLRDSENTFEKIVSICLPTDFSWFRFLISTKRGCTQTPCLFVINIFKNYSVNMYITLSTFKISTSHMVLNKPTISFVDSCINFHMVGLYHVKKGAYVSCSLLTTYIKKK